MSSPLGPKQKPTFVPKGPSTLKGSPEAKTVANVLLEVLAGFRKPADAATALKMSLPRYYALETRALQGLLTALEPRSPGKKVRPETQLARLEQEKKRLGSELARAQALLRMAQRTFGLPVSPDPKKKTGSGPGSRKRRPEVRMKRFLAALKKPEAPPSPASPEPRPEPMKGV